MDAIPAREGTHKKHLLVVAIGSGCLAVLPLIALVPSAVSERRPVDQSHAELHHFVYHQTRNPKSLIGPSGGRGSLIIGLVSMATVTVASLVVAFHSLTAVELYQEAEIVHLCVYRRRPDHMRSWHLEYQKNAPLPGRLSLYEWNGFVIVGEPETPGQLTH